MLQFNFLTCERLQSGGSCCVVCVIDNTGARTIWGPVHSFLIRIFLNSQHLLSGYGFRLHVSSEFGSESGCFFYVWTGKFLNPERKSCVFENIWASMDRGLRRVDSQPRSQGLCPGAAPKPGLGPWELCKAGILSRVCRTFENSSSPQERQVLQFKNFTVKV